jgi:hypothetical protein
MFANFATAIPTGAAVTCMLLFAMQSLISMQPGFTADTTRNELPVFLFEERPDVLNTKDFQAIDLPDIVHAPPTQPLQELPSGAPGIGVTNIPPLPPGPASTPNNPFTNDGPLMAIVRVEPTYPAGAASRFRFKARVIDGVPQISTGVQYRFSFRMDN